MSDNKNRTKDTEKTAEYAEQAEKFRRRDSGKEILGWGTEVKNFAPPPPNPNKNKGNK